MTAAARAAARAALLIALAAAPAGAQPRSAIPWLSDSIDLPAPAAAPLPRSPAAGPAGEADPPAGALPVDAPAGATLDAPAGAMLDAPAGATLDAPAGAMLDAPAGAITVTPLGDVSRDAVGVLAPEVSALPRALWGTASALRVRALLLEHPYQGVPAARALFRRLLLAEADPPKGAGPGSVVLLARLDRLLDLGALEEAEALLRAAGPETPELFRRWFDIGLLTGRAEAPCEALRLGPALSPTLPARVFCLARGGDWNAAEITLTLGEGMGAIAPEQEALLARFLDPALFEEAPDPPGPDPLTALDFTLREAVGLPRPPGPLPLAFLHGDLDEHAPMRARINAGERLVLAGSAPAQTLFSAYRAGAPAASGGVWDRARAVQALDAALEAGAPEAVPAALSAADDALAARGLRVAFAAQYADALTALDPSALDGADRTRLVELLLLGGAIEPAARAAGAAPAPRLARLLAIAGAENPPRARGGGDAMLRAARRGLAERRAEGERETRLARRAQDAPGEAILEALALLRAGPDVDPATLEAALFTLRRAGQIEAARAISLQTLLLPNGG